jgi:HD-like signal output (HDOD) protein
LRPERIGTPSPAPPVLTMENQQAIYRQKLQRVLNNLPPFSPILNRLLASLASEDVRFSDLSGLIEKDTVLSGHVLRLVNSAAMARRSRINSISHAVSVLGLVRLRNFLLSLSIARLWQSTKTPAPWSTGDFNLHAAAVALMSDLLAQNSRCQYPEGAFLAGLLHDYGKLLIAAALPEQFLETIRVTREEQLAIVEGERRVIGFSHPELSAMTLRAWKLPEEIIRGVEYHHTPAEEEAQFPDATGALLLSRVVFAADTAVRHLGIHVMDVDGPKERSRPNAQASLEMLGFANSASKVLEEFDTEYDAIRAFF